MKIKKAHAVYTGGNIWLFYGKLKDGNYFLTDDNGCTLILDKNPKNLDKSTYEDWQMKHLVKELYHKERINFCMKLLDYLEAHPDDCGGMSEYEIDVYRKWFLSDAY